MQRTSKFGLSVVLGLSVLVAPAAAQEAAPATSVPVDSQDAATNRPQNIEAPLGGESHGSVSPNTPNAPVAPEASVLQPNPPLTASSEPVAHAPERDVPAAAVTSQHGDEVATVTPGVPTRTLTDHEASGRIGFGIGVLTEPAIYSLFASDTETDEPPNTVDDDVAIPALIGRYWFGVHKAWALELGVSYVNGDIASSSSVQVDAEYVYVRLGAPIAFALTKHTAFEVIPQLSYTGGETGWEQDLASGTQAQSFALSQWGAAVRLVAELHFGFIDVPELSLQSGIGMEYSRLVLRARAVDSFSASAERYVATSLRPTGGRGPWDIFIGNLSALYHF